MRLLEQVVRRYEHQRWSANESRRSHAFDWGLEHIGGRVDEPDPRGFLDEWVNETLATSDDWFATSAAEDYRLALGGEAPGEYGVLNFTSAVQSPWPRNNIVHARFFPVKNVGPAVVVLPQWNSNWDSHVHVCRWLNAWGITALRMSLPYHDRRALDGLERDNYLVGPNIGLTLQANRQAVADVRRCLRWLEQQGYGKLGILGTSIGSCIAFVTIAHEPAIRAGGLLHVSTYFGDVVRTGLTTMQVWEPLRAKVTAEEIQRYWAPISPFPYVRRLGGTGQRLLLVSAQYDPTFLPEFSEELFTAVRKESIQAEILRLPCGHYSLDRLPFNWLAGVRFGSFLFEALA